MHLLGFHSKLSQELLASETWYPTRAECFRCALFSVLRLSLTTVCKGKNRPTNALNR
jgi:hypothetical protein